MLLDLNSFPIGEQRDWKFGIITREVFRISENKFEINDTSCDWTSAILDQDTFKNLTEGKICLSSIDFN